MARATRVVLTGDSIPCDPALVNCATTLTERIDGIAVDTYAHPADALDEYTDAVDCLVCSQPLDDGGLDFLHDVRDRDPDVPFVYLQSDPDEQIPAAALTADITARVPASTSDLTTAVADAVTEALDDTPTAIPPRSRPPVLVFDDDGCLAEWTDPAGDLFGSEPRVGLSPADLFPDPVADRLTSTVEAALDGDTTEGFESPHPTADGWLDATVYPARDSVAIRFDDVTAWHERVADCEQYREIVTSLGDPIYVLDEAGQFEFVTEAACELLGYDESELLGEYVGEFITDGYEQAAMALIRDCWQSGERQRGTVEGALVPKRGEHIPVENHIAVKPPDEDGTFQGTVGVIRDITDRKRRERELEQYETVMETVPDGVFVLDEAGNILEGNTSGAELLGLNRSDALGTNVLELVADGIVSEDVITGYKEVVRDILSSETNVEQGAYEFSVAPGGDDEERIIESRISPRPFDEDFSGTVGVMRDVTDQRQRVEELERYETLVQAIPETLWATDHEGYFVFTNEAGIERFGFDREAIDAGEIHASEALTDEAVAKFDEATRKLLSDDYDLDDKATVEHTAVTRDGGRFPAKTHYSLLPPTQAGVGSAGILQDITERKQRQQRLQVLNRVLRHNLRNDLTVAITNADILAERLRDEYGDSSSAELAAEIRTVSTDIISISDDIRRIQEALERDGIERYGVDAVDIVETVVDSLREEYPEARIDVELPERAPVEADQSLELAVWNLVENAIEHNDRSVPKVTVSIVREETERGRWLALSVADNGPGIPEQERVVIDDTNEATPLKHSSGVGLWSATWIIQSFDGTIDIADNNPRGSIVTLRFRRAE